MRTTMLALLACSRVRRCSCRAPVRSACGPTPTSPCGTASCRARDRIVSISVEGEYATAVFVLANGKHRRCDAPGQKAAAVFRIHHGKIVSWEQIPVPQGTGPTA